MGQQPDEEEVDRHHGAELEEAGPCVACRRQRPRNVAGENRKQISRLNAAVMGSTGDPFYGAPTLLIVLADPQIPTYLYDGALVMGNLLNAAQAVGVNSCYIFRAKEVFEGPEGKELLKQWGLPERMVGVGNCILGYAAEDGIRPPLPRKPGYIVRT